MSKFQYILDHINKQTHEERIEGLKRAGILTKDGKLAPKYRRGIKEKKQKPRTLIQPSFSPDERKTMAKKEEKKERRQPYQVVDYKPAGAYILVELLEPQEVLNTNITITGSSKIETPQAYILALGPALDASKLGFKEGDRVALSTPAFVPLPKFEGERQKGIIDQNGVRAVLVEGEELQKSESPLLVPGKKSIITG